MHSWGPTEQDRAGWEEKVGLAGTLFSAAALAAQMPEGLKGNKFPLVPGCKAKANKAIKLRSRGMS